MSDYLPLETSSNSSLNSGALWIDGTSFEYWMNNRGPSFASTGLFKHSIVDTRKQFSFVTTSHSMQAKEISAKLSLLKESGLLEKLKQKWHLESTKGGKTGFIVGSSFQGVTLSNVLAYFSTVIVGLLVCVVIGLLETFELVVP